MLTINSNNLSFIDWQKRVFKIEDIYFLDEFEKFVSKLDNCLIENSCKIEGDNLYPARFNLWFQNYNSLEKANSIKSVLNFFKTIEEKSGIPFNYSLFEQFYDYRLNFNKVKKIITGVDLRKKWTNSRFKIWFIIDDYPEKMETAIYLHGERENLRKLIFHDELLVGFDFYLDGRTSIKIYPDIKQEEFQQVKVQEQLAEILSPLALKMMSVCSWTHISFAKDERDKILHYHPLNPNKFIEHFLSNKNAIKVHEHYCEIQTVNPVFSLKERELLDGSIKKMNMYYQPFGTNAIY